MSMMLSFLASRWTRKDLDAFVGAFMDTYTRIIKRKDEGFKEMQTLF